MPQFGKPKGASVGTSSGVITAVASQRLKTDGVAKFPGGTVHIHGVGEFDPTPAVPIVGSTGRYAGATGVVEGRHIAGGATLNIYRLQLP